MTPTNETNIEMLLEETTAEVSGKLIWQKIKANIQNVLPLGCFMDVEL